MEASVRRSAPATCSSPSARAAPLSRGRLRDGSPRGRCSYRRAQSRTRRRRSVP
jgi:hypothetical protein